MFFLSVSIQFEFWSFLRRDLLQHGHDQPLLQSYKSNLDNVRHDSSFNDKIKIRIIDISNFILQIVPYPLQQQQLI